MDFETAFHLLDALRVDQERHADIVRDSLGTINAQSDREPITWRLGRGRSGLTRGNSFPHSWSSAHEAALELSDVAIDYFYSPLAGITDAEHQRDKFEELLREDRRKTLAISLEEVAGLQQRLRREREKLILSNAAKRKGEWESKFRAASERLELVFNAVAMIGCWGKPFAESPMAVDLETERPEPPAKLPSERLVGDLEKKTITLDGECYDAKSELGIRWVEVLAKNPGEWISAPKLEEYDPFLAGARPDKFRNKLPPKIRAHIETDKNLGSRLLLPDPPG